MIKASSKKHFKDHLNKAGKIKKINALRMYVNYRLDVSIGLISMTANNVK